MSGSGILPFKVHVPDEELQYLQQRLESARFPDQLINIAPWEDGTDLAYFKASSPRDEINGRALREDTSLQREWEGYAKAQLRQHALLHATSVTAAGQRLPSAVHNNQRPRHHSAVLVIESCLPFRMDSAESAHNSVAGAHT